MEKSKSMDVPFQISVEIVKNSICDWDVLLDQEQVGRIFVDSLGFFNVRMNDGVEARGSEWSFESLRKASSWAMRHLVTETIEEGV